ncbi:MAG: hypothetical protein DME26_22295, partial [Verrucomicrobia bacterium]
MAQQLRVSSQTASVIPYEPPYKLQPSLLKLAVERLPLPPNTTLNLLLFPGAREKTLPELNKLHAEVIGEDRSPLGPVVSVRVPSSAETLANLAALPGIEVIEYLRERVPANDLSRAAIGVSPDSIATNNYLGLTGSNILVNVNDTGIDRNHPDFAPNPGVRIVGNSALSLTDTNGHGTHVAGIIAGSGAVSTNVNNALGSTMPAVKFQFRGQAPAAKLYSVSFDPLNGPFLSDTFLQETAVRTNAFISNNAWNYGGQDSQTYDIAAASYDAAVRDALPRLTGSQPLLFVFSAGNGGSGTDSGTGGGDDTIQSPATAKNVITVGAIEQPRGITNVVLINCMTNNGTNVVCQTNKPWAGMTDSSDQVAAFSSRGNVGVGIEGDSGRFKPDVVAPGTFVVSTRSGQWDEKAYYARHQTFIYQSGFIGPGALAGSAIFIPESATQFSLQVFPVVGSPVPLPGVPL